MFLYVALILLIKYFVKIFKLKKDKKEPFSWSENLVYRVQNLIDLAENSNLFLELKFMYLTECSDTNRR